MFNTELIKAVEEFAATMLPLTEKELDRPWAWKGYEEGFRFCFFRTILELHEVAGKLAAERKPPTQVQRILAQYHTQYMDLQSSIFGLSPKEAEVVPAENEWPVREVYAHILGAEFGFRSVVRYALEGHRAHRWDDAPPADSEYPRLYGIPEDEYHALMKAPLDEMVAYHRQLHPSIIEEFSTITDAELDLPSAFWEETRFSIRYRVHRFEAHMVQHTIQIDKTLVNIGCAPTESKRLIKKVFAALADVNGAMIGAETSENEPVNSLAARISDLTEEIKSSFNE